VSKYVIFEVITAMEIPVLVFWVDTNVWEKHTASMFRVEVSASVCPHTRH
jgi:hypothetical protein